MTGRKESVREVVPAGEAVAAAQPVEEVRRAAWPGFELEVRHRRDPDGAGEYLALHLWVTPDLAGWAGLLRPWAALAAPWLPFAAPWFTAFTALSAVGHLALPGPRPEEDARQA